MTVTVTVVGVLPAVAGLGETVQVALAGAPLQVKVMAPDNPPSPPTLKLYAAAWPAAAVAEVEEPEGTTRLKSCPVPVSPAACGLPLALSEMVSAPVLVPVAVGVKVTEMVQLAPALTEPPQVLVWVKSPLAAMLEMVREVWPVLVRVTVCALLLVPEFWGGKVSEVGDRLTSGPAPEPFRVTVCGLLGALSVNFSKALRLPAAEGVNVTLTAQVWAGTIVAPEQVSALMAKSPAFAPLRADVETVRSAVPVLVRVAVWAGLVEPMG